MYGERDVQVVKQVVVVWWWQVFQCKKGRRRGVQEVYMVMEGGEGRS